MKKYLPTSTTLSVNKKGFTLVELLVVITILAILMTIGIAVYSGVQKNARDLRRKSDLRSIKVALELYYQTNGFYPISNWVRSGATPNEWITGLNNDYINGGIPVDPYKTASGNPWASQTNYGYAYTSKSAEITACSGYPDGQIYILVAQLENKSDGENIATKNTKWCDGTQLDSKTGWVGTTYAVTSL